MFGGGGGGDNMGFQIWQKLLTLAFFSVSPLTFLQSSFRLCIVVTSTELYVFILVSSTRIEIQGHHVR